MNKYDEILVNPQTSIRLFSRTYLAFGETVLEDRKYKVTREAWIASMYLLGISKVTNSDWWLTPVSDKSGSPDFNCYSFLRNASNKFTERSMIKLEVFEWRKEKKEADFLKALKKIKLDKIVDPQITIICYVRKDTVLPPAVDLNSQIKQISPKVKDIWYLGNTSIDGKMWRLTQIYPNTLAIDLDYDEILQTREEYSFLYGYKGKSDHVEYEPTEKQVLLTPEFEIKVAD